MLRSTQELKNYTIGAIDGEIGHVTDCFFDDEDWVIRYLVVETGSWLLTRKVLISPYSLLDADWLHKRLPVRINRDQVKNNPDIDTEKPVSRQHEMRYADYYSYPYYWAGMGMWGDGMYVPMVPLGGHGLSPTEVAKIDAAQHANDDPHLRSCEAVVGYHIHASDGDIGHVQGMNRLDIQSSPLFDSTAELNRQYELDLHRHYQRSGYWDQEPNRTSALRPALRDR